MTDGEILAEYASARREYELLERESSEAYSKQSRAFSKMYNLQNQMALLGSKNKIIPGKTWKWKYSFDLTADSWLLVAIMIFCVSTLFIAIMKALGF